MALNRGRDGRVLNTSDPTYRPEPRELPDGGPDNTRDDDRKVSGRKRYGNINRAHLKTLYDSWNAAYRGRMPHGVAVLPHRKGAVSAPAPDEELQFRDNPTTFDESGDHTDTIAAPDIEAPAIQDITPIPIVIVDDMTSEFTRMSTYFTAWVAGVTATVDRIVGRQPNRIDVRLMNLGPGKVYIAETGDKGTGGFTLPAAMTAPILIPTTREIWMVQEAAQVSPAQVNIFVTYERRVSE